MRYVALFLVPLGLTAFACASTSTTRPPSKPGDAPIVAEPTVHTHAIPFVEDDYTRALLQARSTHRPLFIDAWAPWCHTCLSMRAYVFTNVALEAHADDFVWLSVDTEKAENARFVEAFPMQVWPTLWVVDPKTEKPVLKWLGSTTAPELASLLMDAKASLDHSDTGGVAEVALMRGDQASAEGRREDAAREYRAVLSVAPLDWPKRPHAVDALAARLWELKQWEACSELAVLEVPRTPPGTSLMNVTLNGLDCATKAPESSPSRAEARALAQVAERLATDKTLAILADDRSSLFEVVVDYFKETGKTTDARIIALKWTEFLEQEVARAPSSAARAVFDAHRMLAYLAIGEPARALPMLAESEREFPNDYNPPARIARVYLELKRYDEALAAADRALTHGYGPRKLRLYSLKADVLAGKGEGVALVSTLREAIAYGRALPASERSNALLSELEKRLADAQK